MREMSLLLFTFRNGKQILIRQVSFTVKGGFFFLSVSSCVDINFGFSGIHQTSTAYVINSLV